MARAVDERALRREPIPGVGQEVGVARYAVVLVQVRVLVADDRRREAAEVHEEERPLEGSAAQVVREHVLEVGEIAYALSDARGGIRPTWNPRRSSPDLIRRFITSVLRAWRAPRGAGA